MIRFFGKRIFHGKLTLSEADKKQGKRSIKQYHRI